MAQTTAVDAISVAVIASRLDAISREMAETMLRTSRSPIFSEARDFVTAIYDSHLRLAAQTPYIPVLVASTPWSMRAIWDAYRDDVNIGDVFILNDPYHGNNHLPDMTVAKPVFFEGRLLFWAMSKGHHVDVGGGGAAGYNPLARSIWEEGIRIPPAKLYERGRYSKSVWDMILTNVRLSALVEADLHCQVGAVNIGERGLIALLEKDGPDIVQAAIDELLDASEREMRAQIRSIPNGTYRGHTIMDHDGINKDRLPIVRVNVTVEDELLTFDFSDSDPQVEGYVNSPLPNTASSVFTVLYAIVDPDVRKNEGSMRPVRVIAKEGTILNPREPAPCTMCTVSASEAIIESIWRALTQAIPDRTQAAWGRCCAPATVGFNPRRGTPFADLHFLHKGGGGATMGFDGWDHMGPVVCMGGLRSPDPELHEMVDPYFILQYEHNPDSAGAGHWRGGLGGITSWKVLVDDIVCVNMGGGFRDITAPFGLAGGNGAPKNRMLLRKADGRVIEMDTNTFYDLAKDDIVECYASGGGGYGNPCLRDAERVLEDVLDGVVSVERARSDYGVVIDPCTLELNREETARLRLATK